MKKMLFATALLAGVGMMSSCSSDEVAGLNAPESPATGSDLVPVELALNGPSVSVEKRGIGTIGDIDGEEGNVWKGEKLRLSMMLRSAEAWDYSKWTYNNSGDVDVTNFENLEVTAPTDAVSGSLSWTDTNPKYYPNDSTPWEYLVLGDTTINEQQVKYVWFKIDGSQDLMAGIAVNDQDGTNVGFSAATARAGVTPKITMQHLLTRFTFQVYPANASASGIKVTKITVKSKTTGKMFIAYNLAEPNTSKKPDNLLSFELKDSGTEEAQDNKLP